MDSSTAPAWRARLGRIGAWSQWELWRGARAAEAAAELEELGFGTLWLGTAEADLAVAETLLAATSRMVLATGIINVWTEPAAQTAAAFHRVAERYPGRLLLGIGVGHRRFVEFTGQRYRRPYRRLVRYLGELDAANVPVRDRVLGALGPRGLALARDRAAGAHPYLVTPEYTRWARGVLGPRALLAVEQKVVLETEPAQARAIARQLVGLYVGLENYTNNLLRLGYTEHDFAGAGSDRLVDDLVAWGAPDAAVARVEEHLRAGADHVCVQVMTNRDEHPRLEFRTLARALARSPVVVESASSDRS